MVRKDEVVEWFQKQSGAGRLDTMCTLLDMCLPFEIRFLGSVMENLGRRDFHELNGVSHSANGFLSGRNSAHCTTASAKEALYNVLLSSPGVTSPAPVNPSGTNIAIAPVFSNRDVCSSSPVTFSGSEVPAVSVRQPEITTDATHKVSSSSLLPQSPKRPQGQNTAVKDETILSNSVDEEEGRRAETWKSNINIADKPVMFTDAENPSPCLDKNILEDETLRRRLILYLSLLTATNRECANAYYKVLLDSQKFLEVPGWLVGLSSDTLEEYCLLFTIAVYHPVFTFEQKRTLGEILHKFAAHSELVQRNIEDEETKFYAAPVQFIGGFDPKFGPYYMYLSPPMPAVGWSPPANMNNMTIGGNPSVEEIQRVTPNTAPTNSMTFTVPHFPPFPMFIQAHHQPGNRSLPSQHQTTAPVPHQFSPQTFSTQNPVSPQSSMGVGPAPFPYPCAYQTPLVAPSSAASHNHIPLGQVIPPVYSLPTNEVSGIPVPQGPSAAGAGGASSLSLSSKSPSLPQLSPQAMEAVNVSCRSNSTTGLFSNTGNSHTSVHIRDSSVGVGIDDNESEEYYESTEDSPYASPPQSLTPSRSHSPLPISNLSRNQTSATNFASSDTSNQHDHHRSSALPASGNQGLSKRSVSSAATSISPPPRSNRNLVGTKISQVVQVQSPKINSFNVEAAISCLDHGKFHKSDTLQSASNPLAITVGTVPAVNYSRAQDNQAALSLSSTINGINNDADTKRIIQHPCKPEYMTSTGVTLQGNTQFSNGQGHDPAAPFQSAYNARRQQGNNHINNSSSSRRPVPIGQVTCTSGQYFPQASSPPSIRSVQVPKVGHIQPSQSYNFYGPSSTPVYYPLQSTKSLVQHQQGPKQTSSNVATGRVHAAQANGSKRDSPNYAPEVKSGLTISSSPAVSIDNAPTSGINPLNLNGSDHMPVPSGSTNFTHESSPTPKPTATLPNLAVACNSGPGLPRNKYILDIGGAGQELRMEPTSQFFGTVEDLRPKKSCYNCGSHTHVGTDCREKTMEDMTKGIYRINFESAEPTLIAEKRKE